MRRERCIIYTNRNRTPNMDIETTGKTIKENIPATPDFFKGQKLPSLFGWVEGKWNMMVPTSMEASEKCPAFKCRNWYFTGRMPRRTKEFFQQWDCPEQGKQYSAKITVRGGSQKGTRQEVNVCLSEYSSLDGQPLPTE